MKTRLLGFVITLFAVSAGMLSAGISEQELGAFARPAEKPDANFVAEEAKGIVAELAKTASFPKWKTFEDDKVKFSYPDHEAITIEVKKDEPVPVDGDRVSTVDTSFSRAYRLVAGGETLLVIMFKEAEWLDEGVCFCGAVVYDRYLVRNGSLHQFSFLEDGIMKKMQVLGERERVMMFEWTHLPMHPAVYREIGRSVELKKKGPWTEADGRKRVMENYGPVASIGWLDEGSSINAAEEVLGRPTRVEAGGARVWEYPKEEYGYQWTARVSLPFADGKLARFDSEYVDSGRRNKKAIKGGIAWMEEMAEPYEESGVRGEEAKKMPEELKQELLALFLAKAEDKSENFNSLCRVMKTLVEQGVKDERALAIVRKRFVSGEGHYAAWVLYEAGYPEDVTLFIDKVKGLYRTGNENPERDMGLNDLHNLLVFVAKTEDKRYPDLLREGLKCRNPEIRGTAYYLVETAPFAAEERIAFVRAGLRDACARVRYWSARYFEEQEVSDQDWEALRAAMELEKDKENLKAMKEVLRMREGGK